MFIVYANDDNANFALATFGTRCLATLMMIMLMIMVCEGYTNGGYTYR